jgi:hypothetical protein
MTLRESPTKKMMRLGLALAIVLSHSSPQVSPGNKVISIPASDPHLIPE